MNAPDGFTLNMSRFIRAPREKVFDAFATEAGLAAWMDPRGMQVRAAQADLDECFDSGISLRPGSIICVGISAISAASITPR